VTQGTQTDPQATAPVDSELLTAEQREQLSRLASSAYPPEWAEARRAWDLLRRDRQRRRQRALEDLVTHRVDQVSGISNGEGSRR